MQLITRIEDIRLKFHIGVGAEERRIQQEILITIEIKQPQFNSAWQEDDYGQAICYDNLAKKLQAKIASYEYKLIEHLCYKIYILLSSEYGTGFKFNVIVKKPNPPMQPSCTQATCEIKEF